MRNNSFIHTALMSSLLLLCGCSEELVPGGLPPTGGPTLRYTIDNLTDGQVTDASTYASGTILAPTADEAKIEEMTLLFFRVADTGNGAYVGYAKVDETTFKNPTVDAWEMHTASITLPSGTDLTLDGTTDYSVLAIANHKVNGWPLDNIKQVVESLGATERSVKYALTVDATSAYRTSTFLMSGSGKYSGKEKSVTIALRRNVAKVMVVNSLGTALFEVEKVWTANMRAQSYVMDMQGVMPLEILTGARQEQELSASAQYASFYCFEHYTEEPMGTTTYSLILKGKYRQGKSMFYRLNVNLHEIDPVNKRFVQRINRNALYKMTITGVKGGGYNTLGEALAGDADQLVTHESFFWDENFDGIYNYASDGIGFATSRGAIDERLVNFTNFQINLSWSDHYMGMETSPEGVTVQSSNTEVIGVTLLSDRKSITCVPKKWGEAVITVTYKDAVTRIPIKFQSVMQSTLYIQNLLVPKYNLGGTESLPNGTYYSLSGSKTHASPVCPSGYRLPTRSEIKKMEAANALRVTDSGFILSAEEGIISLFPNAGMSNSAGIISDASKPYYLTGSVVGVLANPSAVIYTRGDDGKLLEKTDLPYNDNNYRYSVRCIGTVDKKEPYEFVDFDEQPPRTYLVKVAPTAVNYDTYVANTPPDGYQIAGTRMTEKIMQNGGFPGGGPFPINLTCFGNEIDDAYTEGRRYGRGGQNPVSGVVIVDVNYLKTGSYRGFYVKDITGLVP